MSELSYENSAVGTENAAKPVRENIRRAREHRKQFEGTWAQNMAFAAGDQWSVWDPKSRTLRSITKMDPAYKDRELYTADFITEYRTALLGELGSNDDRPELLIQHDDTVAENFQSQLNRAIGFAWNYEAEVDKTLAENDRLTMDLGTAAMRCRFDPDTGPVAYSNVPHENGMPILKAADAAPKIAAAHLGVGPSLEYKDVRAGKIRVDAISAYGLLPPAGMSDERYFPFDCIVVPTLLSDVKAMWPEQSKGLKEDGNIGSSLGQTVEGKPGAGATRSTGVLRGYVWLYTYFERPSKAWQAGRVYYFAGTDMRLMEVRNRLPYKGPDGTYRSGLTYTHWWRVTGRFFSKSLIEGLKDAQRTKNKRRTQTNEQIDRGQPVFFRQRGSEVNRRTNYGVEIIAMDPGEPQPTFFQGFGPGDWIWRDLEQIDSDAERAAGVRSPSLGENPASVTNYSQLAQLREADQTKRQPVLIGRAQAIASVVEDLVYDIKTYWGPEKQIYLAGEEEGRLEAHVFNATQIPPFFIVATAKGSAKPRSQAAELQKIQDIWTAGVASGAVMTAPDRWITWYKQSLDHGQSLDLPDSGVDDQEQKARYENHLMSQGVLPHPAYYDPPQVHVPIHREEQIRCEEVGDIAGWQRVEQHVQWHQEVAMQNAAQLQGGGGSVSQPPGLQPGQPQLQQQDQQQPQGEPAPAPQNGSAAPMMQGGQTSGQAPAG